MLEAALTEETPETSAAMDRNAFQETSKILHGSKKGISFF
jgi:hypothetical protein